MNNLYDKIVSYIFMNIKLSANKKKFNYLFKNGKSINSKAFWIIYSKKPLNNQESYCAFVAPKKHFKKAVQRNRAKRILKSLFWKDIKKNHLWNGDFIVFAKPLVLQRSFKKICEDKKTIVKKLNMYVLNKK